MASISMHADEVIEWCEGRSKLNFPAEIFFHLAAGAAALPAASRIARAQAYPTRPVRLTVSGLLVPDVFWVP